MKKQNDTASGKKLYALLRPCHKASVILSILTALQAVLWVLLAWATRGVINAAVAAEDTLYLWSGILLILAVCIPVLRAGTNAYAGHVTDQSVAQLRQDIWELLQYKDCESVNSYHSGQIFSRMMGDCRTICEKYTGLFPGIVGQAVQLVAAIVALLILRPGFAAVLAVCGCCAAVVGVLLRKVLKARHLDVRRADEQLTSSLQENLEHLEINRSIAVSGEVLRRFNAQQQVWLQMRKKLRLASIGGNTAFSLVIQISSAVVMIWGALAIRAGSLLFGDLTAILQLLNLFRSPVSGLTGVQNQLAAVDAAQERVLQLWDLPTEPAGEDVDSKAVCRALIFDHVTFSYQGEEEPVFSNFTARVEMDRWTCLTGASGRGKSTLYRLILGLYYPKSGRVMVETDRGTVACSEATRKWFSFVPQTPILFSGSVKENLLLAKPDASEEELWSVLTQAECGFVQELPQGLDTLIGEGGEGLSVGQRQRIAIARALLSGAQMLLLDEITSALDHETEERLLHNLANAYPAALVATHKPEMMNNMQLTHLDLEHSSETGVC